MEILKEIRTNQELEGRGRKVILIIGDLNYFFSEKSGEKDEKE